MNSFWIAVQDNGEPVWVRYVGLEELNHPPGEWLAQYKLTVEFSFPPEAGDEEDEEEGDELRVEHYYSKLKYTRKGNTKRIWVSDYDYGIASGCLHDMLENMLYLRRHEVDQPAPPAATQETPNGS